MSVVSLQQVLASLESGARPPGGISADSGEIVSLGGEHLDSDGGFDFTNIKRIPRSFFEKMRGGRIAPRDILVVKDGATTGKTSFVRDDFAFQEAAVNEHVFCVRVDQAKALPEYVFHFLRSPFGQMAIDLDFRGATVGGISRDFAVKTRLPLPPLPEQRWIAEILDEADTLRVKRRAALALLETLTQSVFLEMFGDPASKGWTILSVSDLAASGQGSIRTGPFGSQLLHSEFSGSGIAVLGIDNAVANEFRWGERRYISAAKYRQLRRYTVRPGDVLITIMGTCGRCAVVPSDIPPAINTKHLCCITVDPSKCLPVYLHAYFLRHPIARKYLGQTAKGAVMSGLNMSIIKAMPIVSAPIELQQEFARRVAAIEKLRFAHRASLAELDTLFASLQHRAFRGEF